MLLKGEEAGIRQTENVYDIFNDVSNNLEKASCSVLGKSEFKT